MYKICSIDGCDKKLTAKGLCANHYALMKRNGKPEKQIRKWQIGCAIDGCKDKYAGNGYCMRHYEIQRKYGITPEEYEIKLSEQNGLCKICMNTPDGEKYKFLVVDHNHDTGIVRGLLCSNCNRGIGLLKDNVDILKSAILYLANNPV